MSFDQKRIAVGAEFKHGVTVIEGGDWRRYPMSTTVEDVCFAKDGSVWVGTLRDLTRIDGDDVVSFVCHRHQDVPNVAGQLYADPYGVMWFFYSDGISGIRKKR